MRLRITAEPQTITFVRFTDRGGRFGRIRWHNEDEHFYGHFLWDHDWPREPLPVWKLAIFVNEITRQLSEAFRGMAPAVRAAEQSIRDFGHAVGKAYQSEAAPEAPEVD